MTIKQQINNASIQNVFHLHNGVSHPIHLCRNLSILPSHIVVFFTKSNKLWNKRKYYFLYIWLLGHIMLYRRRKEIASLDTKELLNTHV